MVYQAQFLTTQEGLMDHKLLYLTFSEMYE